MGMKDKANESRHLDIYTASRVSATKTVKLHTNYTRHHLN